MTDSLCPLLDKVKLINNWGKGGCSYQEYSPKAYVFNKESITQKKSRALFQRQNIVPEKLVQFPKGCMLQTAKECILNCATHQWVTVTIMKEKRTQSLLCQ